MFLTRRSIVRHKVQARWFAASLAAVIVLSLSLSSVARVLCALHPYVSVTATSTVGIAEDHSGDESGRDSCESQRFADSILPSDAKPGAQGYGEACAAADYAAITRLPQQYLSARRRPAARRAEVRASGRLFLRVHRLLI
jgi:hypothetical protein